MKNEKHFTNDQDELQVNIANAVNNALIVGKAKFMFNTSDKEKSGMSQRWSVLRAILSL